MEEIINEVLKYSITLAPDPTVLGPKYLQDQIASCRNFTNHTARLLNEVNKAMMAVDYDMRRKETAFKIAADELLANNQHVRNLPNIEDRKAQINLLLRDELRYIEDRKNELKDLSHVEKIVKTSHRELKDTMNEIKLQRSLVKDEYETGRMYGDERPTKIETPVPRPPRIIESFDDSELDRIMNGDTSSVADSPPDSSKSDEELAQDFLGSSEPQKSSEEEEMEAIFNQMV